MVLSREMETHSICFFAVSNVEEMGVKSLGQTVFGLANILFMTGLAGNEVNQIGTFASYIKFARESFACGMAGESGAFVQVWAKLALGVGAFVSLFGGSFGK